jgi:hypothetical protein
MNLPENEHNMAIVKKASDEHGFEAECSKKIPGLEQGHKLGWLTADVVDNELTFYSFPSLLHYRYGILLLFTIPIADGSYSGMRNDCFMPAKTNSIISGG